MEAFVSEFARQGLGYLIAVLEAFIIFFLYKENKSLSRENRELAEKRVEDIKQLKDAAFTQMTTLKDAYVSSLEGVRKVTEATYTMVQNLQNLFTIKNKP